MRMVYILSFVFLLGHIYGQSEMLKIKKSDLAHLDALAKEYPNTRYLIIKGARLEMIPPAIGLFAKLDSLDLYNNRIAQIPDSVWLSLGNLSYLRLGKNPMRRLPSGIRYLENLQHFDLWNAEIESFDEPIFFMPKLSYLDVRATRLSRSELERLRNGLLEEVKIKATWQCNCR
jgi:Leucine-rich repeat (LRR) protein